MYVLQMTFENLTPSFPLLYYVVSFKSNSLTPIEAAVPPLTLAASITFPS